MKSARIRAILAEGPATAYEIAMELRLPGFKAVWFVSALRKAGHIRPTGTMTHLRHSLYELTARGRAAVRADGHDRPSRPWRLKGVCACGNPKAVESKTCRRCWLKAHQ